MRLFVLLLSLASIAVAIPAANAETRMDIGASISNGNMSSFYFALGDYYRVPEREVVVIRERHIPDYDIPVVLFISQHARVAPDLIMDLRLSGRSWMDISLHFGLAPDIFYVPVREVYGPPYGHAYGHYKNKHRKDWHKIRLNDREVSDMVNLRFMSEHYGRPPEEVMRKRSKGKSFNAINDEYRRGKPGREYQERGREQLQDQRFERRQEHRQEQRQMDRRGRDDSGYADRSQRGRGDHTPERESRGQGKKGGEDQAGNGKGRGHNKDD